ncbi:hypothetical protein B0A56_09130 [Flavobacterium columnare NBRC 100251 = ATCC 23463]|nr:hypothetical protein B0A56_09130 [Flavobacterium columnare NBRC 100251 = ATCC 23463]
MNKIKNEEEFLKEIYKIADYLIDISFKNDTYASWLNIATRLNFETNYSIIEESDFSLINGIIGDAIFFYTFYKVNQQKKYFNFAEKLYNTFVLQINESKKENFQTGMLTGVGGVIYSILLIYEMTSDKRKLNDLDEFLKKVDLVDLIENDVNSSIVTGNAGLLVSLCKYIDYTKNKTLINGLIEICAQKLMEKAILSSHSYMYWLPVHQQKPLAGLAHGCSGYALAFHKTYQKTKKVEYKEIVEKTIYFENTLFDKQIYNWIDNRDFAINSFKIDTIAWSHGAPGIGLVRQTLLESNLYDNDFNELLKNDLKNCLKKTIDFGFTDNKDILIYGKLGNLELLLKQEAFKEIDLILQMILKSSKVYGWQFGFKMKDFCLPGFFQGSTGIAYQLLRSIKNNIPSVLSFD